MTISRQGFMLSDESGEAIVQRLENLRRDIGARCIFLANMQGQRIVEVGDIEKIDAATLLVLLSSGFVASTELAYRFGAGEAINLNFHQGSHYEIYSANVGDDLFLAIIYDRRMQTSRIGLVWLYTQRTIEQLLTVHLTVEAAAPVESLDADFGSSLKAELDMVLTEEPDLDSPLLGVGPTPPGRPALNDGEKAEDGRFEEKGAERELLDMETAIARGLIPSNFGAAPEQT